MHELHKWQDDQKGPQQGPFHVHIDALAAMTGVSRFGEHGPPWRYSKEEGLLVHSLQQYGFTHLLSASSNVTGYTQVQAVHGYHALHVPKSVSHMRQLIRFRELPFIIELRPQIFILVKA